LIKTLVSIEVDLASSLAIRFACQLGAAIPMEVHPVYVKEFSSDGSLIGAGWASRTLEREMIKEGKDEISEMITAEMDFCPDLGEPQVIYGDREAELLKIMQKEDFGLYVEGLHFPWNAAAIYKQLHSKFYKKLTFPVVWVRALRKVNQVLILCLNPVATEKVAHVIQKIWKDCPVPLILARPSGNLGGEPLKEAVEKARILLEQSGCKVSVHDNLPSKLEDITDETLNFPLVAIALERDVKKDQPDLHWLEMVKTSSLVTFYSGAH
jgi:hypothetical protein